MSLVRGQNVRMCAYLALSKIGACAPPRSVLCDPLGFRLRVLVRSHPLSQG